MLLSANGLEHHAVEIGEPSAPRLVMLHGLFVGSIASWYFTSAAALARTHRILLYDLRGHGRSPFTKTGYDTATLLADLEALLSARSWTGPISLVGHSYGALVALRFALAHPERVRKLALVEAPLPPSTLPELETLLGRGPDRLVEMLPAASRGALARGGRQAERFLGALRRLALESSLLSDLKDEKDIADAELANVKGALLLYGAQSGCLAVGRRLARVMPDARLAVLPGGHYLHLDSSQAVTDALTGYLQDSNG